MPVFWRLWDGGTGKDRRETLAVPVPGEELVNEPLLPGNTAVSFKSWHVSSAACCGCCRGFWDRTSPSVAICARLQLAVCGNWLCLYQGVKRGLVGLSCGHPHLEPSPWSFGGLCPALFQAVQGVVLVWGLAAALCCCQRQLSCVNMWYTASLLALGARKGTFFFLILIQE